MEPAVIQLFDPSFNQIDVQEFEFAVATAEASDGQVDGAVREVLALLRDKLAIDVVFVGEVGFAAGNAAADQMSDAGQWVLFDNDFCQRTIEAQFAALAAGRPGRSPAAARGAAGWLTVPVVLASGRVYGVLYAPRLPGDAAREQQVLRHVEMSAQLMARRIDEGRARPAFVPSAPAAARQPLAHAA